MPYIQLCRLVEAMIKKWRLRLEDHYHILLNAIQALLRNLVIDQRPANSKDGISQEAKAHAFSRLVTLICEPTAGAVARSLRSRAATASFEPSEVGAIVRWIEELHHQDPTFPATPFDEAETHRVYEQLILTSCQQWKKWLSEAAS